MSRFEARHATRPGDVIKRRPSRIGRAPAMACLMIVAWPSEVCVRSGAPEPVVARSTASADPVSSAVRNRGGRGATRHSRKARAGGANSIRQDRDNKYLTGLARTPGRDGTARTKMPLGALGLPVRDDQVASGPRLAIDARSPHTGNRRAAGTGMLQKRDDDDHCLSEPIH
jgi:hypothetical protein